MADITDPQAIAFCNDMLRPLCEKMRNLKAEITNASNVWFSGVNNLFPNDSSSVDDNRENDGVSRITGSDVQQAMANLQAAAAAVNDQIISKPCVRPLQTQ